MFLNINTPALLFPAISLLLLAYTNRFLTLAATVRQLSEKVKRSDHHEADVLRQIQNISQRILLIRWMQILGILSIICCTLDMFIIFAGMQQVAKILFGLSLVLMIASLFASLWEASISGVALKIELSKLSQKG